MCVHRNERDPKVLYFWELWEDTMHDDVAWVRESIDLQDLERKLFESEQLQRDFLRKFWFCLDSRFLCEEIKYLIEEEKNDFERYRLNEQTISIEKSILQEPNVNYINSLQKQRDENDLEKFKRNLLEARRMLNRSRIEQIWNKYHRKYDVCCWPLIALMRLKKMQVLIAPLPLMTMEKI